MEMLEVSGIPIIFADEIGSVEVIGNHARIVLVEYRRVGGQIVKQPVLELIRPLESLKTALWVAMLQEAITLAVRPERMNAAH